MRSGSSRIQRLPVILLALLGGACGGGSNITAPTQVASVTVSPATAQLQIGSTVQLSAVLTDAAGATLTGRTVSWSSSTPAVASVSAAGLVTGLAAGQVTITATSEGKSGTATVTVLTSIQQFIAAVASGDGSITGTFVAAPPPAAGSGPTLTLSTNGSVIPGGSALVSLSGDQQFTTVIVSVAGATGYYQLTLPTASATAQLLVSLAQSLTGSSLNWQFGAGTGNAVGPYTNTPASIVAVGTGDVQVTLAWNTVADVDLHVIDPSGEEIYYAHSQAASGGQLDLDSNAGCTSDGPRNENITWPTNGAPSGNYRVLVDYWASCTATSTAYSVTVNVKGQSPQTFTGTYTGDGDQGAAGAGQLITTFTVAAATRTTAAAAARVHRLGTVSVFRRPGATIGVK